MQSGTYANRRSQLELYFDRTAAAAWARLTSDAPVSGIRATVRAGRDDMRKTLLGWLPDDLRGSRVLDAGCGTGAFSLAAARRGAQVVAVDLSATLIDLARERASLDKTSGSIDFQVGDMLDPALGRFDHVVGMDSLIHYQVQDIVAAISGLAARADVSLAFTFAPRTPMLSAMHAAGRLFPRGDRAPAIEPVSARKIGRLIAESPGLADFHETRSRRVTTGFYMSHAVELTRRCG